MKDTDGSVYVGVIIPPIAVNGVPVVVHTNMELRFLDDDGMRVSIRVATKSLVENERYFSAN